MKKMSKEALELFRRLDEKKYLVSENIELKEWLVKLGYDSFEIEIQNLIDKIASWYFVKYSNKYLDGIFRGHSKENKNLIPDLSLDLMFQKFNLLETDVFERDKLFTQHLLTLSGYEMIYSKNTNPAFGIARVHFMFYDFNQRFNWNLDTKIYDDIIKKDYSMNNVDNIKLLANLREEQKVKQKYKKKKTGLHRFLHK